MVHAGMAVAVAPDANAHFLEELVGRHERRVDLHRHRLLVAAGRHFFQTLIAVPAEDSCATIGWQVSVWFSTSIFQLQLCM